MRDRANLGAVVALFALLCVGWYLVNGVRIGGDTSLYTEGARALVEGRPLVARQPSYLGYISFVALCEAVGLGLTGVVFLQILIAAVAITVVYRLGVDLSGQLSGILAAGLLAVDMDTNRWHLFVLADSLFTSLLVIAAWLVHRAATMPLIVSRGLAAAAILIAASLVRPEGWFLIPAAASYVVIARAASPAARWLGLGAVAGAGALLVIALAPLLAGNLQAVGPGEMLQRGNTIWDYDGWRLTMPAEPSSTDSSSAMTAVRYAAAHPLSTATLMAARVGVHFAHVRPYFSTAHNAAIVLWLVPIYALAGYGLWRVRANRLARWCVAVIGTQTIVVALTHADWDGRYLAHVMPLVYPFAACGALQIVQPGKWHAAGDPARG